MTYVSVFGNGDVVERNRPSSYAMDDNRRRSRMQPEPISGQCDISEKVADFSK